MIFKNTDRLLFLTLQRSTKKFVVLVLDSLLCVSTVWLAMCLRMESWVLPQGNYWLAVGLSVIIAVPIFVFSGLYRAVFRYAGLPVLMAVTKAVLFYSLIYAALLSMLALPGMTPAQGILQSILLLMLMVAARVAGRIFLSGQYLGRLKRNDLPNVLIYGAGSAGHQLAVALSNSMEMRAVGFLDDDPSMHGQILDGLHVYDPDKLHQLILDFEISTVLLALPSASRQRRNKILNLVCEAHVVVRTLPGIMDLAQGHVRVSDLRELDVEDLLGRDIVPPDSFLLGKLIRDKVVLVTGAGGSIGSELCRQIIRSGPRKLLLVELSEFALYSVHQDLLRLLSEETLHQTQILPLLASVRDEDRMREIISSWRPHTVYHAAAYKHVPMVEHNPAEGVKNNVLGTWTTAKVAAEHGVSDFVLISTDKAVRPTNIMGASKRLSEMVLQALNAASGSQRWVTRFAMVRFGNVLGSSGSVVPLFRKQIKDGGPITLTHTDITRYFMTIPEAAQLVIQAGAMATGGDVFVLDMGEPVRIINLARRMVELSGLTVRDSTNPEGDIEIKITALRPGEKLYEELLTGDNPMPTGHARIMKAHEDFLQLEELSPLLDAMSLALQANDVPLIRTLLKELVRDYQPEGKVVDWVHLAREGVPC